MTRLLRALRWAIDAYRYQRNKPHGARASRYHAAMLAAMGAHIIAFGGSRWPWLNVSYWLLMVGRMRLRRKGVRL